MSFHILIVPSWYSHIRSPGGGSFFRDQAQALAGAGHKVGLIYPKVWGVRDYRAGPLPEMNAVHSEDDGHVRVYRRNTLHRLPRVPFRDSFEFCRSGARMFDAYCRAEGTPDLIHAHGALYGGVLAAVLSRRTGIPAVLTEHSTDYGQGKHRWWQKRLIGKAFRAAAARIAVSSSLAGLMAAQHPGTAPPVEVIPNILTPAFEDAAQEHRANSAEADGPFVFLCVARISEEKNQIGLIRAFAEAAPDLKGAELHFIGSGDGGPLLASAEEKGLGSRVKVLGTQPPEQVQSAMASAGAVVLPSFVETFGVVVIEAHAMGAPVVATASGGPEELVTPENGILIPVGDHGALTDALRDIHRRRGEFDPADISRACLDRFGRKAVVDRLETIYDRIAGQRGGNGTAMA